MLLAMHLYTVCHIFRTCHASCDGRWWTLPFDVVWSLIYIFY